MKRPLEQDCINGLIERARHGAIDRRSFIKAMGMMASLPLVMRSRLSWADEKRLVVVNWGGDAIENYFKTWGKPFEKETGIEVVIDGSGPTAGAIKIQHASGNTSWDVVDLNPFDAVSLGDAGAIQPIDYSIVDQDNVLPGLAWDYSVSNYFYSYILAYDGSLFGDEGPKSWKDFWDVKRFPQMRTAYKWMTGVLETSLLADGVPSEELYPLDIERAFSKIKEVEPYIIAFWDTGAMSQQLMLTRQAPIGMIWNTRAMMMVEQTEGRIRWSFDHGILTTGAWGVMSNNPAGTEAAMKFIASAQDPSTQVKLFNLQGNGPANPAAHSLIPDDQRYLDCSSPENRAKQTLLQMEWYADHYGPTLERFLKMIAA